MEKYLGNQKLEIGPNSHMPTPNNADGNYEATYNANAIVYSTGRVEWTPPAVFHRFIKLK